MCPELPCPGDFTSDEEEGGGSTRVVLIIAIVLIVLLIIIIVVILMKREWREKIFRKIGPKETNMQYSNFEGNITRAPPTLKREYPKKAEISYRQESDSELNLNLQLTPDVPGVLELEPDFKEPEPEPQPKPKPRTTKTKERPSLKESFTDIDKFNAFNDKGKKDDEQLVEINVEELLQQQKEAMRKELKKQKESIRNMDNMGKKRPASRQRLFSDNGNVAFTNDHVEIGPQTEPETMDNVLNEMQSRRQTPEPQTGVDILQTTVIPSRERRRRQHSGHSDRSKRSHEGRESRSSRDGLEKRPHGEKREHRRRKEGHLGNSMRSTDSSSTNRSNRPKRKHSRSTRHGSPDPKATLMPDGTMNEFTNLGAIDELSGSLV